MDIITEQAELLSDLYDQYDHLLDVDDPGEDWHVDAELEEIRCQMLEFPDEVHLRIAAQPQAV